MTELEAQTMTAIQNYCKANTPTKRDLRAAMTMAVLPVVTTYTLTSLDKASEAEAKQVLGDFAPAAMIAAAAVGIADATMKLLTEIK